MKTLPKNLIIGPLRSEDNAVGGIVVLFENLISYYNKQKLNIRIVDTNSKNYRSKFLLALRLLKEMLSVGTYSSIELHATFSDVKYLSAILIFLHVFFRKKFVIRKFAGNFDELLASEGYFFKKLIKSALRKSCANFFETKNLVETNRKYNKNTYWFPNVREVTGIRSLPYAPGEQFKVLYLSQVMTEKGIFELIDSICLLENCSLTVAGPINDKKIDFTSFSKDNRFTYVGHISSCDIYEFMSKFHCLVLPTKYRGEGYPGVIIESFMIGLPVICTDWKFLGEMFDNKNTLINDTKPSSIAQAISKVKFHHNEHKIEALYNSMKFDSEIVNREYLEKIKIVFNGYYN